MQRRPSAACFDYFSSFIPHLLKNILKVEGFNTLYYSSTSCLTIVTFSEPKWFWLFACLFFSPVIIFFFICLGFFSPLFIKVFHELVFFWGGRRGEKHCLSFSVGKSSLIRKCLIVPSLYFLVQWEDYQCGFVLNSETYTPPTQSFCCI